MDYSPYLGKDWKPEFNKPAAYVCNHSCWCDILIAFYLWNPGFTAKREIQTGWFGIGKIATMNGTYFINRTATSEERKKLVIDL